MLFFLSMTKQLWSQRGLQSFLTVEGLPGTGNCHVVVTDFFRCIMNGIPLRMACWQLTAFGKAFFMNHHFAKSRVFMNKWNWRKQFMLQTGVYREHEAEGTAVTEPVFAIC